jgi:ABC-2 type transport system ATP-binding protein
VIDVERLSKRYGHDSAVEDVSFRCMPGTITGFLGPNGAGKSTTMRMICGLTPPSAGSARVNGVRYADLPNPGRYVGVLLDAAAVHPGRTGREALTLAALVLGVDHRRVPELLSTVGLDGGAARRRVGEYSLGMRQRLGLAHALLGGPSVLILDEPANGLDPAGMYWMRELLRDFADRGGAVLLSSHLLREVDAVSDRLVVIVRGRIVASGTRDELVTSAGSLVRADDPVALDAVLARAGLAGSPMPDGTRLVSADPRTIAQVAAAAGVILVELRPAGAAGLEQLFLNLTTDRPSKDVR